VSGWQQAAPPQPDEPPPTTYWSRPSSADPLAPGQLIRRAWRLYRAWPRLFLLVAIVPEAIRALLAIPSLISAVLIVQGVVDAMADLVARVAANPDAYRYPNSTQLQVELQDQFRAALLPQADLATWSAVGGGAGVAVGLIGTSALTAAALTAAAGHPISVGAAYRQVAARRSLLLPIVVIGVAWTLVSVLPILLQGSPGFQAWAGSPGSPRSSLLGGLLGIAAIVVGIAVIVLAVRWALYIPATLIEELDVGSGLARAATLTKGIRFRLGLASIGVLILEGVSVWVVAGPVGLIVGISASSVAAGFWAYVVLSLIGSLLWAPLLPSLLANAYRARTNAVAPGPTAGS